jgi:predicted HAD superfamily phosphohydrolase YqeG
MENQLCLYIDVDETLVRSMGSKRIPIPAMIRHVAELHGAGALLFCWSSGGADSAQRSAEEFGLAHCFAGFLPKPNVIIDDQSVTDWPHFLQVHPSATRTIEEYRAALRGFNAVIGGG